MAKDYPESTRTRQQFLLSLFPVREKKYETIHLNGFVLERKLHQRPESTAWIVAVYTEDHFKNLEDWREAHHITPPGKPTTDKGRAKAPHFLWRQVTP